MSLRKQIMYLVNDMNFDYSSLITTLMYKKKMPTLEEAFTMLHVHEHQIVRMHLLTADSYLVYENFARYGQSEFWWSS